MRGRFIAFEGGEGAGKSGAITYVAEQLRQAGHAVVTTHEPGGTPEGQALRALLLSRAGEVWDPAAELLLMTAARVQHVKRVIIPAVGKGAVVLCDRYVGSTLAYQGAGRGLSSDLIADLHHKLVDDVWPDLTIVLDIDPVIGLARSRSRLTEAATDEGRFEALDLEFHRRVRSAFLDQAATSTRPHIVIDTNRPMPKVREEILKAILGQEE